MASEKLVRMILAMNGSLHPSSVPADAEMRGILRAFWLDALAPFYDSEVEPVARAALQSSPYPLKPADIVPRLTAARLGLPSWEAAFSAFLELSKTTLDPPGQVPEAVTRWGGERAWRTRYAVAQHPHPVFRAVAAEFVRPLCEDVTDIGIVRAQFRDAYLAACERYVEDQRNPGGLLALPAASRVAIRQVDPTQEPTEGQNALASL